VVEEMNRPGVIVDVAHSGQQTSLEAAKVSTRPIVASHSGTMAMNEHVRNRSDDVIRAICDGGGYVGICVIPPFLGRSGDINAMLDHIDRHFPYGLRPATPPGSSRTSVTALGEHPSIYVSNTVGRPRIGG